jgi:hypothetical protein
MIVHVYWPTHLGTGAWTRVHLVHCDWLIPPGDEHLSSDSRPEPRATTHYKVLINCSQYVGIYVIQVSNTDVIRDFWDNIGTDTFSSTSLL